MNMKRLANTDKEHQEHLDILAGSDEKAAQELIRQINQHVHPWMHVMYMYPDTMKGN